MFEDWIWMCDGDDYGEDLNPLYTPICCWDSFKALLFTGEYIPVNSAILRCDVLDFCLV